MATTTIRMNDSVGYITIASPIEVKVSVTNPTRLVIPAHQVRASFGGIGASTSRAYKASYRLYNRLGDVAYYNVDSSKTGYVANASTNANVASFNTDAYIYAGSWFNSNNSTTRTIESALTLRVLMLDGYISSSSDPYDYIWLQNPVTVANVNVTLDAPPTFTASNVSFDTSYVYTGLTTASVDVSSLSAKFGGSITDVKLTIGNQNVTRTNNGTLSILLEAEGTFTPTVTVTDSRGQVTTKTLEAITVNGYTAPSAVFTAERTTSTGVDDDEGEYAVLDTNITFTDVVADLTAPTVTIDGTPATVTWYSSRATDGTLSGTVNWSSLTSPATVYGLIAVPNIQTSYSVSLTPNDTEGSGLPITQTIASAFYTIDFLAGGHGIAFGQPSSRNGFECNMPTTFHDTVGCEDTLTAPDMTAQEVSDFVDSLDLVVPSSATSETITRNDLKAVLNEVLPSEPVEADYVVEQGTSGIWGYRKWASGIAECWGYYSKTIASKTVDNSNYITFPFAFTAKPKIVLGLVAGGGDIYRGHIEDGSTNATQVRLTLINQHTGSVVLGMNIHATGRWK